MKGIGLEFTDEVMNTFPNPAEYLDSVVTAFVTNVKIMAQQELKTARQDYINAVTQYPMQLEGDKVTVTVELVGRFPNMLESGVDSYDMKEFLLGGKKHRTIFMRKGTPQATRLQKMTSEQHKIMKHLQTSSDASKFPSFLTKQKSNVTAYGVSKTNSPFRGTSSANQNIHGEHVYQRMQKIVRGKTATYGTFRSVSENSEENSWIHPGFKAHNIFDKVLAQMDLS